MKIFILIIALVGLFSVSTNKQTKVFLCNGSASTKYHLKANCKGLERCTTELDTLTIEQAEAKGRTLCGYEKR